MKYKNLKKNTRVSFKYKNNVRSGLYLKRFFNKKIKKWFYIFNECYGIYWTIPCEKTIILLKD